MRTETTTIAEQEEDEREDGPGAEPTIEVPAAQPEDDRGDNQLDGPGQGVAEPVAGLAPVTQLSALDFGVVNFGVVNVRATQVRLTPRGREAPVELVNVFSI